MDVIGIDVGAVQPLVWIAARHRTLIDCDLEETNLTGLDLSALSAQSAL